MAVPPSYVRQCVLIFVVRGLGRASRPSLVGRKGM
jgi:hypothetical protein